MARAPDDPLSVEEAKTLLREVAADAGPGAWVRDHPGRAVAVAFVVGWLTARRPESAERLVAGMFERLARR